MSHTKIRLQNLDLSREREKKYIRRANNQKQITYMGLFDSLFEEIKFFTSFQFTSFLELIFHFRGFADPFVTVTVN